MKGVHLPAATFRNAASGLHHNHYQPHQQEQKVHGNSGDCAGGRWWPVYSLVMLAIVMGLVVPVSAFASPFAGLAIALVVACVSVALVYRFVASVRSATMTDWEYVRMPGALVCLDIYLFVCLNWALIWFVLWATDKDDALLLPVAVTVDANQHLVYLIILYNVLASFWFSGGGRLYPASPAAYAWGFLSLVIGAWLALLVVGWLVHIVRRSPSRVNENTPLPVYHTPVPVAPSLSGVIPPPPPSFAQQQQQQPLLPVAATAPRKAPPTPQEQEEALKTFARLAQIQKEQRLAQERLQQQQKSTKAKDI